MKDLLSLLKLKDLMPNIQIYAQECFKLLIVLTKISIKYNINKVSREGISILCNIYECNNIIILYIIYCKYY